MPQGTSIIAWVAVGLGAGLLTAFLSEGWSEQGVRIAVRLSAQVAVVCFVLAFSASSLHVLLRSRWTAWVLANRRPLGLSFALAHTVHLGALAALAAAFPDPFVGELNAVTVVGGGVAYAFLLAMAATSNDAAVARIGGRRWRRLHRVGGYYIWLLFIQSYAPRAVEEPFYIPFALILIAVPALRGASWRRGRQSARSVATAGAAIVVVLGTSTGLSLVAPTDARAGQADVLLAKAHCDDAGLCHIEATIKHADVGWSHYADRFDVSTEDGNPIASRVLRHPHVHEQPFTRTLNAAEIPDGVDVVVVRAHDSKHGNAGRGVVLSIERPGRTSSSKEAPAHPVPDGSKPPPISETKPGPQVAP